MMAFLLGCAAHGNGTGIFKVFSIIHHVLADCLVCHHIGLALKQQLRGGVNRRKVSCIYDLVAPGIKKKGLDIKKTPFFPVIGYFRILKDVAACSMCLITL